MLTVTSSALPPAPANCSPVTLSEPLSAVGPSPPGTAPPSTADQSASSVPRSSPTSWPRNGPSGPRSIAFALITTRSGVGTSVGGSGAALSSTSRFFAAASTAALTRTTSGWPARRSCTVTSSWFTSSSRRCAAPRSMKRIRAPVSAARSTRMAERSAGFSSPAAGGGSGSAGFFEASMASSSRPTFCVPSASRMTLTESPVTSTRSTWMSRPRERSAVITGTTTSARWSVASGSGSPGPGPTAMSFTTTPSRGMSWVAIPPTVTSRPHSLDHFAASARARAVSSESR